VGSGHNRGDGHCPFVKPERELSKYNEDLIFDLNEGICLACFVLFN